MSRFLIDRSIFDNNLWRDYVAFRMFFYLVGNAVFKEGVKIADHILKRGQLIRSYRKLQEDLSYEENNATKTFSTATIFRATQRLKNANRITTEETKLGTLFTVVNYESYQLFPVASSNEHETSPKQQRNDKNKSKPGDINQPTVGAVNAPKHPIWGDGLEILVRSGLSEDSARAFLGRTVKQHGEGALSEAISATLLAEPVNPKAYLIACLSPKRKSQGHNRLNGNDIQPAGQRQEGALKF
jgi:hypothetical protein